MDNPEQILAAATQLFASHGFEGVSLQAIADRVGVTKQTLLYHYASKEALHRAVLDNVFEHWRERLPQMLQAVTSGQGRFAALTEELATFFQVDPNRARLLSRELLDNPEGMRQLLERNLKPWVLLVAQYVKEGQRLGAIREDVDAEAYVWHVIVLVVANVALTSVLSGALGGEGISAEELNQRQLAELCRLTRTALFKP